ncbi:MAG: hypothetical protein MI861_22790, partial [Pirellulales bacterium]|nr:hypothetical protein [Pirellulales bacterium]
HPLPASVGILNWQGKLEDRITALLDDRRSAATAIPRVGIVLMLLACMTGVTMMCGARWVRAEQQASPQQPQENQTDEKETRQPQFDSETTGYFSTQVTDTAGNPVAKAEVDLWQVAYKGGSRVPRAIYLRSHTTDELGKVSIPYPKFVDRDGRLATSQLGLRVKHRDYPQWSEYLAVDHRQSIRLAVPVWVTIAANLSNGAPIASDLFVATGGLGNKSQMLGPTLRVGPLDLTGPRAANLIRVVHAPDEGPILFSKLVDLSRARRNGNEISLAVELEPAATVRGTLGENVPRPINNGVVIGRIIEGGGGSRWDWSTGAEIAKDGTFTLHDVPQDQHLQLIAICDGWISLPPRPSEVTEYSRQFAFDVAHNFGANTGRVTPWFHYTGKGTSQTILPMHQTGAVKITVVDWDNKPISDVNIRFSPNQAFHNGGSQHLGDRSSSVDFLRKSRKPEEHPNGLSKLNWERARQYGAPTDHNGQATITNLPTHLSWHSSDGNTDQPGGRFLGFHVQREGYRLVPQEPQRIISSSGVVQETVDMVPGGTATIRVRMERLGQKPPPVKMTTTSKGAGQVAPTPAPKQPAAKKKQEETIPITVSGVARNQQGQPVAGAQVHLLSFTATSRRLAQTTTDAQGRYQFKDIPLPIQRSSQFIDGGSINVYALAEGYGMTWHGKRSVLLEPRPANLPIDEQSTSFYEGEAIEMDLEFLPQTKLHGQVVDTSGKPVAGVKITLGGLDYLDTEGKVYHANFREFWGLRFTEEKYRIATTDQQGNFEIAGLPDQTVGWVRVSHGSYADKALYAAMTDQKIKEYTYASNSMVTIRDGKQVRFPKYETKQVEICPLKIVLAGNQKATVEVVDRDKKAVSGIRVSASSGGRATGTFASAVTDKTGVATLELPPGQYRLVARPDRTSTYVTGYGELTIPADQTNVHKQLRLVSGCTLLLKAVDAESGDPIAGMSFWRDVKGKTGARTGLNSTPMYVDHPTTGDDGVLKVVVEPGQRTIGAGWSNIPKPYRGGGGGRKVLCKEGETLSLTFEMRRSNR